MNRSIVFLSLLLWPLLLMAQDPEGSYNPYVNSGVITPSPLLPVELNGTGLISFNIGNTGSDPLEVFSGQYIILTITLSYGEPDNADPVAAVGGTYAGLFSWSYSEGTYTAVQTGTIPAGASGSITIDYKVTQNSTAASSLNGFNVNISPAPYQNGSNTTNDDAVSSYTYTEIRDYGDAPAGYGSVSHVIDFENYLGTVVDGEGADLYSAGADGDDLDGADDEDGVTFPAEIHREDVMNISVMVTGVGRLNAWIDWNGDGDFLDTGERIASNLLWSEGIHNIEVTVPANAVITAPAYARFRYSIESLTDPWGNASSGEVEDYRITILCKPPIPTLSCSDADAAFCAGTMVTFTAGGGSQYDFRVDGSSVQTGTSNTYATDALTNGQKVDVIVSDAIGCSATSDGITVTVHALPVPALTSSDVDNTFCAGTVITFNASGGTNYNFRVDESTVQNGSSASYTTGALTNGQVVDVIVTNANGCSATSPGITSTVNPLPVPTLAISDADSTFCLGTSVIFTATGGTDYHFRVDGSTVQNSNVNTYETSALSDGQVTDVIVTDANGCIAASGGITSTVIDLPTADAGSVLEEICQGGTTTGLGGSIGGSATGGTWSSPAGGTFTPSATTLNATWTPPPGYTGTATLTLTTTGGECGTASDSKTQVVNPVPTLVINDPEPVCAPATVDLTDPAITAGSTTGLIYTYWMDEAGTTPLTTPTAASAGTYYIMGTLSSTGCSSTGTVTVTEKPTPDSPLVTVTDNCDGTSVLSTTASGTLLWSTGATTASIIVNSPGTYTVTTTIDGCTSDAGEGTAAPKTAPAPPVVSNAAPENLCPDVTVDLTALVTSTTPSGGAIFYKTTNDPQGADIPDPTTAGAGAYYLFYLDAYGCYSTGTEVLVTINACPPDLTPTLVVSPNIMHGVTNFDLVVRITELNGMGTSGVITVNIPKDSRWILTDGFVQSLTMLGATPLNNSNWSYYEDAINHIFTSTAVITAGGYSTFGFRVTFDPGNSKGIYSITSQVVTGGGGEERGSNNADSERLDYFQE